MIEPFPPGHDWGRVQAPDGRWAQWRVKYQTDLGDPVVFRRPRDVDIRLRWTDGAPAAGQWLRLSVSPRGRRTSRRTDEGGRAVFPACVGESAAVRWSPVEGGFGTPLALVQLQSPPGPIEIRLERPVELAIRILVDGAARLPSSYEVRVPDTAPERLGRRRTVTDREFLEDAEAAEIRFCWVPLATGEAPEVTIDADGYPPATAVPVLGDDGVWRGTARLAASATLLVRVQVSEGGRYYLKVERWDPEGREFVWDPREPAMRSGTKVAEGTYRYEGLPPGRYRLSEHYTGSITEPFELRPGAGVLEVPFDLTSSIDVEGRVIAPDEEEPGYARVWVRTGETAEPKEVRVGVDGRFTHRALRGQRLRFSVEHPALRPAGNGGTVEVVAGEGAGPVLRLESAPMIAFRIEGVDFPSPKPGPRIAPVEVGGAVRVRLTSADVPVLLPAVEVAATGVKDLGTLILSEGATLTVRLHSTSVQAASG